MRDLLASYSAFAGVGSAIFFAYLYRERHRYGLDQIASLFVIAMFGSLLISLVSLLLLLRII